MRVRRTRSILIVLTLVSAAPILTAGTLRAGPAVRTGPTIEDYEEGLANALELWNERLTWEYEHQLEVVELFEDIARANPDRWEAWYWASHSRTQLFGGPDRDPERWAFDTDVAQNHLGRAARALPEGERTPRQQADFLIQQSLIYGHRRSFAATDEERNRLRELSDEATAAALEVDPTNPRARMFVAMARIGEDVEEGRILLAGAAGHYQAYPPESPIAPDWGRRWIDFWLAGQVLNDDGRPGAGTIPYDPPAGIDPDLAADLGEVVADWKAALAAGRANDADAAARAFELTERYPDSWLIWYWAAHMSTQLAGPDDGAEYLQNLDRAQTMLDRAEAALPAADRTARDAADLHMMQALLWNLRTFATDDGSPAAAELVERYTASLEAAEAADPDNPRAAAFRGFDLIRDGEHRAGTLQLAEAIGKYEAYQPVSTLHPDWGRRWVDFWLAGGVRRQRQGQE